jgi:hypothetical protein
MQIAIGTTLPHRPSRAAGRMVSLVAGVALVVFGLGTAVAVVRAPATPGFDDRGPALVQSGGAAPLSIPDGAPGDTAVSFTTITYAGTGAASVRLFAEVTGTGLAPHLAVRIERGAGDGTTWVPDPARPVYEGTLAGLPADWSRGLGGERLWAAGEDHTFRITVTMMDHPAAQGRTAAATFRWEARAV